MPARRCAINSINFPTDYRFNVCPVCGESTEYIVSRDADEDWATQVAWAQEQTASEHAEDEIPSVNARVVVRGDNYFIHAWDIYHAGLRHTLKEGTLLRVGQQVFEVTGRVDREYLVRPFSMTLSDEDLAKLASGE